MKIKFYQNLRKTKPHMKCGGYVAFADIEIELVYSSVTT